MSVLKDFTAVLQNKPGNAHYRQWKQKNLLFCLLYVSGKVLGGGRKDNSKGQFSLLSAPGSC